MDIHIAIEIAVVGQGFLIGWTDARGIQQQHWCQNRDVLAKTVHRAADEVRGGFPKLNETTK